jgi:hypothetical protein
MPWTRVTGILTNGEFRSQFQNFGWWLFVAGPSRYASVLWISNERFLLSDVFPRWADLQKRSTGCFTLDVMCLPCQRTLIYREVLNCFSGCYCCILPSRLNCREFSLRGRGFDMVAAEASIWSLYRNTRSSLSRTSPNFASWLLRKLFEIYSNVSIYPNLQKLAGHILLPTIGPGPTRSRHYRD